MVQLADIVVKDFDGTTDRYYSGLIASGGDKSPAIWRCGDYGNSTATHPFLTVSARNNGTGTARRMDFLFEWPEFFTSSVDGSTRLVNKFQFVGSAVIPNGMSVSSLQHAGAQCSHLFGSAKVMEMLIAGYAAV